MGREAHLWFSREHTSESHPERHTDSYRQVSDQSHCEKTGHNECEEREITVRNEEKD